MKRLATLLAIAAVAVGIAAGSAAAMNAGAVSAGGHAAKTPLVCACGGGGLPYCDSVTQGAVYWATWFIFIQGPQWPPSYSTGYWKCSYGSAASIERTWTLQYGLDPDSGPGKAWLPA